MRFSESHLNFGELNQFETFYRVGVFQVLKAFPCEPGLVSLWTLQVGLDLLGEILGFVGSIGF